MPGFWPDFWPDFWPGFGPDLTSFWPGFLALDQNGDGTDGRADGRDGRTGRTDGRTDGTDGIQFCSTTGTEKYSFAVLLGRRNSRGRPSF